MLISQFIILLDFTFIFSLSSCHELRRPQMEFLNESICVHCSLQKICSWRMSVGVQRLGEELKGEQKVSVGIKMKTGRN